MQHNIAIVVNEQVVALSTVETFIADINTYSGKAVSIPPNLLVDVGWVYVNETFHPGKP